jgi:hypothetical protein
MGASSGRGWPNWSNWKAGIRVRPLWVTANTAWLALRRANQVRVLDSLGSPPTAAKCRTSASRASR